MTDTIDLEIFARVARTGNMSAAGREMGLSPAVVSKRVGLLEERLGVRLFQRTTRQLTLTDIGEGYFRRVVDILNLLEEAEDLITRRTTTPRGLIKITVSNAFARKHIIPHLARFQQLYPDIELDFHLSDEFIDIIKDGMDLAIRIGELKDSTLVARKLASESRILVAAPGYLEIHGEPKTLKELELHECLFAGGNSQWLLEGPDGARSIRVRGKLQCSSHDFICDGLIAGLGIGLAALWDVAPALDSGALRRILPRFQGSSSVGIHAVYPSREFMPAKVQIFIDYLAAIFADPAYWGAAQRVRAA